MPDSYVEDIPKTILTKTSQKSRRSDSEFVLEISDKYRRWADAEKDNRERMFESLGAFMDIAGGSWPDAERQDLISKGRHPTSINIAHQKLQSLAGSIYSEKWDYNFTPLDLNESTLTKGIKYWYYADKEQFDYDDIDRATLMNGLIHGGYDKLEIDYGVRNTGAIKFRACQPGSIIPDPYWTSDNFKDWREAMEVSWMTAEDIENTYQTGNQFILAAAARDRIGGYVYEPSADVRTFENIPETWGSKYLVVQYRWLERVRTTRIHIRKPDGEWAALPLNIKEDEVRNLREQYGASWKDIKEFPYEDDSLYLCAVCPQLAPFTILTTGKHEVQCGSIGIFPFTSFRVNGVNKGVMEALLDIQRTLNYRQSKLDDIIASIAAGGSAVNLQSLPRGERDLEKVKQNITRPDFVFGVNGDPSRVMAPIPRSTPPESIFREMDSLINMFDRVCPVTPALEGSASGDESGVLFEMRHSVSKLGTLLLYERWKQYLMNKAEAWYNQAQIQYKGMFKKVRDEYGNWIEFNSPVYKNGERFILNNVEDLPRSRVIINLSTSSPTERFSRRMELFDVTKMLSGNPVLFQRQIRFITNQMLRTLEGLTPDQRSYLERIDKLEEIQDLSGVITAIKELEGRGINAEIMIKQAQGMLQQLEAGGGQPPPPEALSPGGEGGPKGGMPMGGGAPAEQGPPLPESQSETPLSPGAPIQTIRGNFQP